MKCMVKGCCNYSDQGAFAPGIAMCMPCHHMITTGEIHHANPTFIGDLARSNNKNARVLASFVKYCEEHPHYRFWQALRNWSGYDFILASNKTIATDDRIRDTFYWEDRDK